MKRIYPLSAVLILLCFALVAGCKGTFKANAYKTLSTTATVYDTSMKAAADLHRQGLVSDQEKAEIIEFGNKYRQAHQAAVTALSAYERTKQATDQEKVLVALDEFSKVFGELMAYLRPVLLRNMEPEPAGLLPSPLKSPSAID
jgi:GTP cyclohydrolase III